MPHKLDVKLTIEGIDVPVGFELLSQIAYTLPDNEKFAEVFEVLAHSNIQDVRQEIARKGKLNAKTVEILAKDQGKDVILNLLGTNAGSAYLTQDDIESILERFDSSVASKLAYFVNEFKKIDFEKTFQILLQHDDPKVRYELIRNYETRKIASRKLALDEDIDVALMSQQP